MPRRVARRFPRRIVGKPVSPSRKQKTTRAVISRSTSPKRAAPKRKAARPGRNIAATKSLARKRRR